MCWQPYLKKTNKSVSPRSSSKRMVLSCYPCLANLSGSWSLEFMGLGSNSAFPFYQCVLFTRVKWEEKPLSSNLKGSVADEE